ncbi:DUF3693 domain-containing protein [Xanthomonas axonopodis]|uniref:DUF3693 domain-containing protein n=1 Tax=Xanthomonas axonopodis TaxID=53413 RepID=UPI0035580CCB
MKDAARTSPERTFWKRLSAVAMTLLLCMGSALPGRAEARRPAELHHSLQADNPHALYIMRNWPCPRTGARPAISTAARAPGRTIPNRQADAVADGQGLRQAAAG